MKGGVVQVLLICIVLLTMIVACSPQVQQSKQADTAVVKPVETIKWRAQAYAAAAPRGIGHYTTTFPQDIKEITQGKLVIDMAPPGSIVPAAEVLSAVSSGTLDMAISFGSFTVGTIPEADIEQGLPFSWQDLQEAWAAYYTYGLLDELRSVYAKHNVYFLAPAFAPIKYVIQGNFAASDRAQLAGKKIRTGGLVAELFKEAGMAPVALPVGDVYMALKTGTIDAAYFGIFAAEGAKLHEVSKYVIGGLDAGQLAQSVLVNMNTWNKLPPDMKQYLDKYARYVLNQEALSYFERGALRSYASTYNLQYVQFSQDDAAKMSKYTIDTLWQKVADKSPNCNRLVNIIRKQMKDLGRL